MFFRPAVESGGRGLFTETKPSAFSVGQLAACLAGWPDRTERQPEKVIGETVEPGNRTRRHDQGDQMCAASGERAQANERPNDKTAKNENSEASYHGKRRRARALPLSLAYVQDTRKIADELLAFAVNTTPPASVPPPPPVLVMSHELAIPSHATKAFRPRGEARAVWKW